MRQWELIGITDHVPAMPVPHAAARSPRGSVDRACRADRVFFWSCDGALRVIGISDVAADVIGRPSLVQGPRSARDVRPRRPERGNLGRAHLGARRRRRDIHVPQRPGERPLPGATAHRRHGPGIGHVLPRDARSRTSTFAMTRTAPPSPEALNRRTTRRPRACARDLVVAVRRRQAPELVAGGRQVHAAVEHVVEEARVPLVVGGLRVVEVADRPVGEEHAEHRPRAVDRRGDARAASNASARPSGELHRASPRASAVRVVSSARGRARRCPPRPPPGSRRACPPGRRGPTGASCSISSRRPPNAAHGNPPPMILPSTVRSGVTPYERLRAAVRDAEPRDHLVEDQQRAVLVAERAQALRGSRGRRDDAHVRGDRLDDHARRSARRARRRSRGPRRGR